MMTTITVNNESAVLIEASHRIIAGLVQGDGTKTGEVRSRRLPVWNPDGTEVMSVKQASVIMNLPEPVVAHHVLQSDTTSAELRADAVKVIRHVRDTEYWHLPYGTPLIGRGKSKTPLSHLTVAPDEYKDGVTTTFKGSDGKAYVVTKDDETGEWVALDEKKYWDGEVARTKTEDEAARALNEHLDGKKNKGRPGKPADHTRVVSREKAGKAPVSAGNRSAATRARSQAAKPAEPKLNTKDKAEYDKAPPAVRKAYLDIVNDDSLNYSERTHHQALATAYENQNTSAQNNAVRGMDTLVRDWYWELRRDGMDHSEALSSVKAYDKLNDREDFDYRKHNAAIKKVGRAAAMRQALNGDFGGVRPTSGKTDHPGDTPKPTARARAQAIRDRAAANNTGNSRTTGSKNGVAAHPVGTRLQISSRVFIKHGDDAWAEDWKGDSPDKTRTDASINTELSKARKTGLTIMVRRPSDTAKGVDKNVAANGRTLPGGKDTEPPGEYEKFGVIGGHHTTVVKLQEGTWATRTHTGRVSAQGRLYHHIRKFDSHESAVAYAKKLHGKDEATTPTGNREDDYGPVKVGDRVIIHAPGGRGGSAKANAHGKEGRVIKASPKNIDVELDDGRKIKASRNLVLKNNSGLKSPGANKPTEQPAVQEVSGVTVGDRVTLGQARSGSLVYTVESTNGDNVVIADSNGTKRSVKKDRLNKVGGSKPPMAVEDRRASSILASNNKPKHDSKVGDWVQTPDGRGQIVSVTENSAGRRIAKIDLDTGKSTQMMLPEKGASPRPAKRRNHNAEATAFVAANRGRQFNIVKPDGSRVNGTFEPLRVNRGGQGEYVTMRDTQHDTTVDAMVDELKPVINPTRKGVTPIARTGIVADRPVDAFNFTRERQQRLQDEYDRWVNTASPQELILLLAELRKMSTSGALTHREKAAAKVKAEQLAKKMKGL